MGRPKGSKNKAAAPPFLLQYTQQSQNLCEDEEVEEEEDADGLQWLVPVEAAFICGMAREEIAHTGKPAEGGKLKQLGEAVLESLLEDVITHEDKLMSKYGDLIGAGDRAAAAALQKEQAESKAWRAEWLETEPTKLTLQQVTSKIKSLRRKVRIGRQQEGPLAT